MPPIIKNTALTVCMGLGIFSDSTNLIQSMPGLFRALADIIHSDENKNPVIEKYVIHFDSGRATLPADAGPILQQVCNDSRGMDKVVHIEGHADSQGSAKANDSIAMMRTKAVATAIVLQCGFSEHRIKTHSFSSERPVRDNQTEAGRARNRRVEIEIIGEPRWLVTTM